MWESAKRRWRKLNDKRRKSPPAVYFIIYLPTKCGNNQLQSGYDLLR